MDSACPYIAKLTRDPCLHLLAPVFLCRTVHCKEELIHFCTISYMKSVYFHYVRMIQ